MATDGPQYYDAASVFETYSEMRKRRDSPNETIEAPVFDTLVGDPRGLRVLDLGCGTALLGRDLLARGASEYVGLEGSRKMAAAARTTLRDTSGVVVEERIETWPYPSGAFDLVVSRLALHYIADIPLLLANVAHALVDGGRLIFSVEHPAITSCSRGWKEGTVRQDWLVDDYFKTGARVTRWLGGEVQKYHRTVEDYFAAMTGAGFAVEELREGRPRAEMFADAETFERRRRIPLFLILAGRKRVGSA
jgi:SAM-dependent methyltransferase